MQKAPIPGFSRPIRLLTEKEAAELEVKEAARKLKERQEQARVPSRYANATIRDGLPPDVLAYVRRISKDGRLLRQGPWLVLSGSVGTGKTHAACAIVNEFIGYCVRFTSFGKILGELKDAFARGESSDAIVRRYAAYRLLVIDDFGKDQATRWAVAQFFRILSDRYDAQRPTIITTNHKAEALERYLTVDGDADTAAAILDRITDSANVLVTMRGKSRRR